MRACAFLLAVIALVCSDAPSYADKKGPPRSRKIETAGGKFVFVMLSPQTLEQELRQHTTDEGKALTKSIRDIYPKSGLYKNDGSNEPLWTVDWYNASVFPLSDGVHLIRHNQPMPEQARDKVDRPKREITDNDMKQEAVSVFANGKLVREFTLADLVDDRKGLGMSVTMILWMKERKIDEQKRQMTIVTRDGNRVVIDIAAGKILEKKKAE